ncbi:hypothetical protein VPH35_017114 [Triticum aestivum]
MDSKKVIAAANLTDDLVVEILSRVPFKSFRFKCVCKAWLAFASDPHYQRMSPNDEEINGALTFLPHHEHLEFVDCCNGLVLCKYKISYASAEACRFIMCNPATREWRSLPVPDTQPDPTEFVGDTFLAFDPSWSAQFYVFNFHEKFDGYWTIGINKLEVFSSDLSTWIVDAAWSPFIQICNPHHFIGGVLYVHTDGGDILGLEVIGSGIPPRHFTFKLPQGHSDLVSACFGQSLGGHTIAVFSLDTCHSYKWSLKYRLSMGNYRWLDYQIVALDSERKVLFLVDKVQMKLLSYDIITGKLSEIEDGCRTDYLYYAACYSKLPVLSSFEHTQETC